MPVSITLRAPECCVGLDEHWLPTTRTICIGIATCGSDLITVIVQWSTKRIVEWVAAAFLDRLIAFWIEQFHETVRKQPRSLPKQEQRYTETKQQRQSERCENDRRNDPHRRAEQKESQLNQPVWCTVVGQKNPLKEDLKRDVILVQLRGIHWHVEDVADAVTKFTTACRMAFELLIALP